MATYSTTLALRAVQAILEEALPDAILVVPHNAAAPWGDAQDANDNPPERWCRIASLVPSRPAGGDGRASGDDGDHKSIALTVSVGASNRLQDEEPTRIEEDADLVADALRGAQATAGGQTVTIHTAWAQAAPEDGSHPSHRLFIVSATGRANRL